MAYNARVSGTSEVAVVLVNAKLQTLTMYLEINKSISYYENCFNNISIQRQSIKCLNSQTIRMAYVKLTDCRNNLDNSFSSFLLWYVLTETAH